MTFEQLVMLAALAMVVLGIAAACYGLRAAWMALKEERDTQKSLPAHLSQSTRIKSRKV